MPRLIQSTFIVAGAALLLYAAPGCAAGPAPPAPRTPVVFQLHWLHQASSAGYYVADRRGFYGEEGLDVTMVEGGPEINPVERVMAGEAHLGIRQAPDLLDARARGHRVVAIAAVFRRPIAVFMALESSGITRPQEFEGKAVRVASGLHLPLRALMTRAGVPPGSYQEVVLPSDADLFATGDPPVWGGVVNGLAVTVRDRGLRVNFIYPDDYGYHAYSDTIFASEEFLAREPETATRFLRATLRGFQYAVENPGEAGDLVRSYAPGADAALETRKWEASIPLVHTGQEEIGWMRPEVWAGMGRMMQEFGLLAGPVEAAEAYSLRFLEAVYPGGGAGGAR